MAFVPLTSENATPLTASVRPSQFEHDHALFSMVFGTAKQMAPVVLKLPVPPDLAATGAAHGNEAEDDEVLPLVELEVLLDEDESLLDEDESLLDEVDDESLEVLADEVDDESLEVLLDEVDDESLEVLLDELDDEELAAALDEVDDEVLPTLDEDDLLLELEVDVDEVLEVDDDDLDDEDDEDALADELLEVEELVDEVEPTDEVDDDVDKLWVEENELVPVELVVCDVGPVDEDVELPPEEPPVGPSSLGSTADTHAVTPVTTESTMMLPNRRSRLRRCISSLLLRMNRSRVQSFASVKFHTKAHPLEGIEDGLAADSEGPHWLVR